MWHSTGANNPWLKRYVQPDDNAPDKAKMLELLGKNKNGKTAGFEGFTTKVGELYKVQVGAYKDSVKAENFRQTVKKAGFPAMVVKALTGPQEGPREGFKPYRVQVHTPVLNVRQGPSTGAVRVGSVQQGEVLTITEESTGQGATLWGKVENKNGWISLDFAKKV